MSKQVLTFLFFEDFQLLEGGSEILGTTVYWSDMDVFCLILIR